MIKTIMFPILVVGIRASLDSPQSMPLSGTPVDAFYRSQSLEEKDVSGMTRYGLIELDTHAVHNRAPYGYSGALLRALGPDLSWLAMDRMDADKENYGHEPLLGHAFDNVILDGIRQKMYLGKRIGRTTWSTIFEIKSRPDLAVKYALDSEPDEAIHPLVREYLIMRMFEHQSFVPRVRFLSPPTFMVWPLTEKTYFRLSQSDRTKAVDQRRHLRFMVMDKVDEDLYKYVARKGGSLQLSINTMIWLIDALKIIHSRGIVHGDIHARNVAWRQGSDSELVLIDFGLSATSQELSLNDPKPYEVEHLHCLHSQWQLDGWRSSFRDDMYRVLLLGSFLLNGMKFFEYGADLEIHRDAMIDFKKNGMIFAIPGSRVVIDPQTRAVFEELLVHVRGLTYMDTPDYALMRSALKRVPLSSQFSH
jgi:hypothetical protein